MCTKNEMKTTGKFPKGGCCVIIIVRHLIGKIAKKLITVLSSTSNECKWG